MLQKRAVGDYLVRPLTAHLFPPPRFAVQNLVGRGLQQKSLLAEMKTSYDMIPTTEEICWGGYEAFWDAVSPGVSVAQQNAVEEQYPLIRRLVDAARAKAFAKTLELYGEGSITERTARVVVTNIHDAVYVPKLS